MAQAFSNALCLSDAHPILPGEFSQYEVSSVVITAEGIGVVLRKFGHAVAPALRTLHAVVTALFFAVLHIVIVGAKKEMLRIYAFRVIAMVANKHPVRDYPVVHLPRYAVCSERPPVLTPFIHKTMTEVGERAGPNPAIVAFFDHCPKTDSERSSLFAHPENIENLSLYGNA